VKFCIDTAHCRWAGQDFSDFDAFMNEWNDKIGEDKLYSFHLNDAKVPFWAHLDRHAPLGRGLVWFPNLVGVIQYAAKTDRHIYIETTKPELRPEEIQLVHSIAAGKTDRIADFEKKFFRTEVLKKFQ
jgi:endonuclease IV